MERPSTSERRSRPVRPASKKELILLQFNGEEKVAGCFES